MSGVPRAERLQRCLAGLVALEDRIEGMLDRLRGEVRGHPGMGAALERFRAVAQAHREALVAHRRTLGDDPREAGDPPPAAATGAATGASAEAADARDGVYQGTVSRAMRDAYLAFNEATVAYAVLHETAHVCDSLRYATTLRLAERHLRGYAGAAQELNQMIADVVAWELRQEGQFCECQCPSCNLGICWCIAHTTDVLNTAWRETAPAQPAPGLRVVPNPRCPSDLDVREGDLVIAVDGQRVARTSDVTTQVMSRRPGESIRFGIERRAAGALEIVATRR